jgi:GT2 family glycosyltransferase
MISIIICSIIPERFRRVCDAYSRVFSGVHCEVIGVHDASSLAEAYNRAIPAAKGDLLIFSHDDIDMVNPDFGPRLLGHMDHADLVGIAGATRVPGGAWASAAPPFIFGQIAHYSPDEKLFINGVWGVPSRRADGIKVMDGVFLCARRELAEKVLFDQTNFDGFHGYDMDFTFRAHLAGFRLAVGCDLCILHGSTGKWDKRWEHYERLFISKHMPHLDRMTRRTYRAATVGVESFEELQRIMTPPWWDR